MNDTPRKYPVDIRILRIGFGIVSAVLSIVYALLLNPVNRLRHRGRSERKLEIGPGFKPIKGFEAVNIVWTPGVDYVYDTARKMPFASGSFDLIYASHVLEHIPWYLVPSVLKEWQRILKPGGTIEIWVPDGLRIARAFVDAEDGRTHSIAEDGWYKFNADRDPAAWACGRIFSYGDGKGKTGHFNWHLGLFSERYLKKLLTEAGFADCRTMDRSEVRASDHGWINLGVAGAKSA